MAPVFSVVITTYNRPEPLQTCLAALARLDYPKDGFEVIVVDDGSEAALDSIVKPFQVQLNLTLVMQPNGGAAKGRNTGVGLARGRYLAFTDDDCQPAPDWLTALECRLTREPGRLIGGRMINALPSNHYSSASQLIVDIVYSYYNTDPERARFFATANMALSAERFREVGGFDEGFVLHACEDREFCDRWLHRRYAMTYAPEAVVYHAHLLTLSAFCRQHFTYGRGAVRFHQVRAQRGSGRLVDDLAFHWNLRNWLLRPFRQASGRQALRLAALLLLWQVTNAAGFLVELLTPRRM